MSDKKVRPHGAGGLYRPKFRGPDGKLHEQSLWWTALRVSGHLVRESTGTAIKKQAEEILRQRLTLVDGGAIGPHAHRVRLSTLEEILNNNYAANGRNRLAWRFAHLRAYFVKDPLARDVTTDRLEAYARHRLTEGAKPSTINREFAALRRAFRLALRSRRVAVVPVFPMLREDNVRRGFFEAEQFDDVVARLPSWVADVVTFMFWTGWRTRETLLLQWRNLDVKSKTIRLDPGTTKNRDGRTLPYGAIPELRTLIARRKDLTKATEREHGVVVPWVFFRGAGEPLVSGKSQSRPIHELYKEWRAATVAAGLPGKLFHDFRRSAVRRYERAGVSRSVAMQLTGHKTESVYRRYAIVSEADLTAGLTKVAALTLRQRSGSDQE